MCCFSLATHLATRTALYPHPGPGSCNTWPKDAIRERGLDQRHEDISITFSSGVVQAFPRITGSRWDLKANRYGLNKRVYFVGKPSFDRTIMANMDDYFIDRAKAASDCSCVENEPVADIDSADAPFEDVDVDIDALNVGFGENEAYPTFDTENDPNTCDTALLNPMVFPGIQDISKHSADILKLIVAHDMLANPATRTASEIRLRNGGISANVLSPIPGTAFLKQWVKNEKTDNKLIVDGNREIIGVRPTQVVELIRDALQSESMLWNSRGDTETCSVYPTVAAVSKEYTLNLLQHKAFCKIGKALLTRWLITEPGEGGYEGEDYEANLSQDQLLFFLGGAGGTGKSRVIDAVSRFCCGWKRDEGILKAALTGKAATLIHGRTLAKKGADFIGVDIIVIDEVSMMRNPDWTKLDKLLRQYKPLSGV
ncbi:LOW QUALITY PROTEIN: hypothetical protein PHMEG_00018666 [Phytophthora megakarya]|uniref:Uncharacterized protein n=1 Tax=Phytophthora megakarya TaxID=4795 RepID=A0A225VW29_9STRA|nr:LOW QUALITY PROTEIN: hypothetical protein PHMEG_00018666 [Phytophthora megakarya]